MLLAGELVASLMRDTYSTATDMPCQRPACLQCVNLPVTSPTPLLWTAVVRPLVRCLANTAVAWDDEAARSLWLIARSQSVTAWSRGEVELTRGNATVLVGLSTLAAPSSCLLEAGG